MLIVARTAGLLGGLAWLVRWPLAGGEDGGAAAGAAYWLGLVLLAVSLAAYGAALVKVGWLKVVVGVALPVLVWSVLEALHGGGDGAVVDGLTGLGIALLALAGLVGARRADARARADRGGGRRAGTGTHAR